jgi:hypothetical protein
MDSIKIVHASQAKSISKFNNIKLELLNCKANIYFNKICKKLNITPKYIQLNSKLKSSTKPMTNTSPINYIK